MPSSFATEDYVWYGTNGYNFEKLPNPRLMSRRNAASAQQVIVLSEDEYSKLGKDYFCSDCTDKRIIQNREAKEAVKALPRISHTG